METITLPCGVVIVWTKFDKAESPTKIMDFLDNVFPTADPRPDYVCIDKACQVLRYAVGSGRWNVWQNTTRFIVDAYHYINHRTTDYLCRKYCNPAPLNGSAPNLVVVEKDKNGQPYLKRAFNTEVCITLIFNIRFSNDVQQASEQFNAFIGGFESILSKMTGGNFNWFLHVMIFMHTLEVIYKQEERRMKDEEEEPEAENEY